MKCGSLTCVIALTALATLVPPVQVIAQHTRYRLIDLGTFGGPNSYFIFVGSRSLNNRGMATGGADTPTSVDPQFCFNDCFLAHTFLRQNGTLADLGAFRELARRRAFLMTSMRKGWSLELRSLAR